jgi:hypothetical protein
MYVSENHILIKFNFTCFLIFVVFSGYCGLKLLSISLSLRILIDRFSYVDAHRQLALVECEKVMPDDTRKFQELELEYERRQVQ